MPRIARQKFEGAIYHVMCRSISEIDLLKHMRIRKGTWL
jgi:hypothetical protein